MTASGPVFYRAPNVWRLRLVQVVLWGTLALIASLFGELKTNPNNGPADAYVFWGGVVLVVGLVVAYEVFLRLYVIDIRVRDGRLIFTTLATVHHHVFSALPGQVTLGPPERWDDPETGVATSHRALGIADRDLPLIVDLTAAGADVDGFEAWLRATSG